jgi:predicted DCC family thiol-disulfide oxidoreductase YuxK
MWVLLAIAGAIAAIDLARTSFRARLRTTPAARTTVLYDGHCRFCTTQARNLARLTKAGALELVSFQDPGVLERFPGVTHDMCMRAMQLITTHGRVYSGFEAAVHAVGPLAYIYYVPGIRLLCDAAYWVIAKNRYRLMGKAAKDCPDGACQLHLKRSK